MTHEQATRTSSVAGAGRTLIVGALGTLLVLAIFSTVVTTIGASARSFGAGITAETWALSAMSLGLATTLLTIGALADAVGRRRVLVWSSALLAAASALGALAPTVGLLVAARVLQGVAGAGVLATSLGLIGHAFPAGAARTRATGVWGAAVGAGIALGPLVGAALSAASGWRSGYWLEAVAAAMLVPAALALPESRAAATRFLDLPGAVLLGAGMASLTAGLVQGRTSWSSATTLALLAGGGLLLVGFAVVELRRRHPMVDLRRFANPLFVASIAGSLFTGLAVIGLMSYAPTLMQRGMAVGVLASAALLATWSATSVVVALGARRLPAWLPAHARLAIGLALTAAGELALTGLGAGASGGALVPGLIVAGIGSGLANSALGRLAVESVPPEQAAMGSGASNTARYLGGAAGVALVVALASGGAATDGAALLHGWDDAALVSAGLCAAGALIAACCRVPALHLGRPAATARLIPHEQKGQS